MGVEKSQEEFPWKVTECYNGEPWISWEVLGLEVKDDKYKLRWKNSCDMSHSWNGIVRLLPGQVELMHTHTTPDLLHSAGQPDRNTKLDKKQDFQMAVHNDPFQVSPWDHQRHKRRGGNRLDLPLL